MADNPDKAKKSLAPEEEVWIAISAFEQILEAMPNDRASLEALSHAYEQIGDHTRAKDYLVRLARVVVDEGDAAGASQLAEQLNAYADEDSEVAGVRDTLVKRFAAGDTTASDDAYADSLPDEQPEEPRYEAFNLADELSFAWALLESKQLTQDEYAAVVQDLTEMSSSEGKATVSVLHALELRAFKHLERLLVAVSKQTGAPIITLSLFDIQHRAITALPPDFMARRGAAVFDFIGNEALVAVMNPFDQKLRKSVGALLKRPCHFFMTLPSEFDAVALRARELLAKPEGESKKA